MLGLNTIALIAKESMIQGNKPSFVPIAQGGKRPVLANINIIFNGGDSNYELLVDNQKGVQGFEDIHSVKTDVYSFYVKE